MRTNLTELVFLLFCKMVLYIVLALVFVAAAETWQLIPWLGSVLLHYLPLKNREDIS